MTVILLDETEIRHGRIAMVQRLGDLATRDELVIVYGAHGGSPSPLANMFVGDLRRHLPRHDIVGVHIDPVGDATLRAAAFVHGLLEAGSLPVVVTPTATANSVSAELASYLGADHLMRASSLLVGAGRLDAVWQRRGGGPALFRISR